MTAKAHTHLNTNWQSKAIFSVAFSMKRLWIEHNLTTKGQQTLDATPKI
ncbi:hypothetical protein K6Q96_10390 [Grimontia kaedaensis]|uniref:Uncharacterized protein n=1 Tax=Grimontia kaedaensis TaxID=2872157 RepID=A0ABY4WYX2_9GAMM|nr:hypothetical protein [Grimontia kaedaensis]USH04185.1 hypothetical protein K6Q96_10390 [Grimontia kaedaensis]